MYKSLLALSAAAVALPAVAQVPTPVLRATTAERFESNGLNYLRYRLEVTNRASFPAALFAPAPNLPPCGTNRSASRTWVDIFDEGGRRLYGFCAITSPDGLGQLWYSVALGIRTPRQVYVQLTDRQTNRVYRSDPVSARPGALDIDQLDIANAENWLLVRRLPGFEGRTCAARNVGEGLDVIVYRNSDGVPLFVLTRSGWRGLSGSTSLSLSIDGGPSIRAQATMSGSMIVLNPTSAVWQQLQTANWVDVVLPSEQWRQRVTGLGIALRAVDRCIAGGR